MTVRHYEYLFNFAESECFSSNSVTILMPNFDLVLISGELLNKLIIVACLNKLILTFEQPGVNAL